MSHTCLYYFSGTGNSLAVARDLAAALPADLFAMAQAAAGEIPRSAVDALGLVFPVYHGGLPGIVRRWVSGLRDLGGVYVFAVSTYGDSPGIAMEYLSQAVRARGGKLAAGFGVHMPYNYLTPPAQFSFDFFDHFGLREISSEKQQALFAAWKRRQAEVVDYVNARREGVLETDAQTVYHMVDRLGLHDSLGRWAWVRQVGGYRGPLKRPFCDSVGLMDAGFWADERCNGCGLCVRLCPVDNITLADGRPAWRQRCEQCFACLQWCPQSALQFRGATTHGKRYHHPDVKLVDLLRRP